MSCSRARHFTLTVPLSPTRGINAWVKNNIRINKFFEMDFTKKVNVKKQRRFDRSTVIFKLKSKNFCMRLKYIQSIIKMLMRYRLKL